MYTLRRISGDGVEMNLNLGNSYTFVSKEMNPKEFKRSFEEHFKFNDCPRDKDNCYGFVGNGEIIQPLYNNQKAYMMTENGKTFDNLSFR